MKTFIEFTIRSIILGIIFALLFRAGELRGRAEVAQPVKVEYISQSRVDVYNVYMLKNCLQTLQTLQGETYE